MRVLVTGRGSSGSWEIRGRQLGAAIGATVRPNATSDGHDLVVLVKRPTPYLLAGFSAPVVWDVVDAWPQPEGNEWDRDTAMRWLRARVREIRPVAIVAATERMAADCAEFGVPAVCIPHHARPGQAVNPIRDTVRAVGYEGGEQHLGGWKPVLERLCERRGWRFMVNPPALEDVDIVVALRHTTGYPARQWKSGVKLANAQATGTPCILSPEQGYREIQSGAEHWAETEQDLALAFDRLTDKAARADASRILRTNPPELSSIADRYRCFLTQLRF